MAATIFAAVLVPDPARPESDPISRQSQPAKHSLVSPKRLPTYAAAKALVQDLRASQDNASYRLVLDLTKKVRIVQKRDKTSGRLQLDLLQTNLSKAAADKFVAMTILPRDVRIALVQQRNSLRLSLNKNALSQYHYFLLERPHRFVLDFTPVSTSGSDGPPDQPIPSKAESASRQAGSPPAPIANHSAPASTARGSAQEIRTIVIDPGHGGKDAGTISRRGLTEKQITLKVSLRLRDLIKTRLGKHVLMTRERDEFIELGDRAKFANANNADLFVSIHVNSHPQSSVKGLEIYHFGEAKDQRALEVAARENGTPINNGGVGWEYLVADLLTTKRIEDSLELAWQTKEAMLQRLNGRYPTDDHGVKTAPFYVLRYTAMPSILAEIAFMSNPSEEKLLRQTNYINEVAEAIFLGLKNYISPTRPTSP
ncbi:N-acetylmuramoyl-L-alanine amidase [Nitrospira sp.]|nr:N-acetylmuramoyl-L-alanine amidase [Nitrospira sp.]